MIYITYFEQNFSKDMQRERDKVSPGTLKD